MQGDISETWLGLSGLCSSDAYNTSAPGNAEVVVEKIMLRQVCMGHDTRHNAVSSWGCVLGRDPNSSVSLDATGKPCDEKRKSISNKARPARPPA